MPSSPSPRLLTPPHASSRLLAGLLSRLLTPSHAASRRLTPPHAVSRLLTPSHASSQVYSGSSKDWDKVDSDLKKAEEEEKPEGEEALNKL